MIALCIVRVGPEVTGYCDASSQGQTNQVRWQATGCVLVQVLWNYSIHSLKVIWLCYCIHYICPCRSLSYNFEMELDAVSVVLLYSCWSALPASCTHAAAVKNKQQTLSHCGEMSYFSFKQFYLDFRLRYMKITWLSSAHDCFNVYYGRTDFCSVSCCVYSCTQIINWTEWLIK